MNDFLIVKIKIYDMTLLKDLIKSEQHLFQTDVVLSYARLPIVT